MSLIPDFANIDPEFLTSDIKQGKNDKPAPPVSAGNTPEGLDVRSYYEESDIKEIGHLDSMPGFPPFVRGPYPTLYVTRPWTIRQYAGFSTAEE